MAQKKETGEQKLLRLIEEQGGQIAPAQAEKASSSPGQDSRDAAAVAHAVQGLGLPAVSLPPALQPILKLLKGGRPGLKLGLKEANNLLAVVVLLAAVVFIVNLVKGFQTSGRVITLPAGQTTAKNTSIALPSSEPLARFIEPLKERNIFQPYEKKVAATPTAEPEVKRIDTVTKGLKLVGISSVEGDEEGFAMIEDAKSGITHFLSVGESINEVTVKTIKKDEVILSYQGEEITMKL